MKHIGAGRLLIAGLATVLLVGAFVLPRFDHFGYFMGVVGMGLVWVADDVNRQEVEVKNWIVIAFILAVCVWLLAAVGAAFLLDALKDLRVVQ